MSRAAGDAVETSKAMRQLRAFEERARKVRDEWLAAKLKGKTIETDVRKLLEDRVRRVILETLGMRQDSWGHEEWDLHRTNGRRPPIYEVLDERVRTVAVQAVTDALAEPITLTKGQRDAIRKAYRDQLEWRARDIAGERGAADANEVLDRIMDELDEDEMRFCPRCMVKHLEPLHQLEAEQTATG